MGIGVNNFRTFIQIVNTISDFVPELSKSTIGDKVANKYRDIQKDWEWSFLKARKHIYCIAPSTTGTLTVVNGSPNVTGVATAWTANMAGRSIRFGNDSRVIYQISGVTDPTHLILTDNYGGQNFSGAYTIFQNIYQLGVDVRDIRKLMWDVALVERPAEFFDRIDPYRSQTGTPMWYADQGLDSGGLRMIEIYPIPADAYVMKLSYWKSLPDLVKDNDVVMMRGDLLQEASLVDCYRVASSINSLYKDEMAKSAAVFQNLWINAISEDMRRASPEIEVRDYELDEGGFGTDWERDHFYGGTF
jgi:hypothetical protein